MQSFLFVFVEVLLASDSTRRTNEFKKKKERDIFLLKRHSQQTYSDYRI